MIKKISIMLAVLALLYVALVAYATSRLSIEHLIICAADGSRNAKPLVNEMCNFYFYNIVDESDAAELNEGAGISFATQIPDEQNRKKAIQHLLSLGLDINGISNNDGFTALGGAVISKKPSLVEYLLSIGADRNAKDAHGRKAFEYLELLSDDESKEKIIAIFEN